MDFYIIIVPALALSLCMLLNLLVLRRRDKYLFAELQQSQDIVPIICEKLFNISKEEHHEPTEFTRATDKDTIEPLIHVTELGLSDLGLTNFQFNLVLFRARERCKKLYQKLIRQPVGKRESAD